ncbi:MAG: hypothetical protein IKP77_01395 [Acholeplasmatales bacterium]|nr:hypothetical protein [Acholeplasmatales bacterium]
MFGKKSKVIEWDRDNLIPVIHKSICTGEAVVGFKNKNTREFVEIMLINSHEDLEKFVKLYGIDTEIKTEY